VDGGLRFVRISAVVTPTLRANVRVIGYLHCKRHQAKHQAIISAYRSERVLAAHTLFHGIFRWLLHPKPSQCEIRASCAVPSLRSTASGFQLSVTFSELFRFHIRLALFGTAKCVSRPVKSSLE